MRCPDCNKFVSYDEPEVECDGVDINGDSVSVSVRVALNCAECGTTLKEATIEGECMIEHICKPVEERIGETFLPQSELTFKEDEEQFEIEDEGIGEGTDRLETKDRNGKLIKNYRYMKKYYGFSISPEIRCRKCGEFFSVTIEGEEQASCFDECC